MTVPQDRDAAWTQYTSARTDIAAGDPGELLGVVGLLHGLCTALTVNLAVMGVAVHLMSAGGSDGVAAASDDRCRSVEELQFTTGEGPCLEAFAARRPVLAPDLLSETGGRWPGYASAALLSGVAAVFAFPLHVGSVAFGVLDVFSDHPGSLTAEQETLASTYAQIATEIMLDGELTTIEGELDPALSSALDDRAQIHQAQGMVVFDLGVDPAEALARMKARAFSGDEALIDLAREIISGFNLRSDG